MKAFFIMGITYCIFCASAWANDYAEETGKISYFQVHKNPTDESNSGQRFIVRLDSEISSNKCGNSDSWTGTDPLCCKELGGTFASMATC